MALSSSSIRVAVLEEDGEHVLMEGKFTHKVNTESSLWSLEPGKCVLVSAGVSAGAQGGGRGRTTARPGFLLSGAQLGGALAGLGPVGPQQVILWSGADVKVKCLVLHPCPPWWPHVVTTAELLRGHPQSVAVPAWDAPSVPEASARLRPGYI